MGKASIGPDRIGVVSIMEMESPEFKRNGTCPCRMGGGLRKIEGDVHQSGHARGARCPDVPPWEAAHQQTQRWLRGSCWLAARVAICARSGASHRGAKDSPAR
ncbi:hypothetical protein MAFF211271_11060 [Ralstonia syzygii subsp. indonesiensis]|nr:hypothetical protein MAFF211271_11060 [Ralstonia pseudosolanacearum]